MRLFIPLLFLALLAVAACGDDDDSTVTPNPTASASLSPTPTVDPTGTPTVAPTLNVLDPTPSPTPRDVVADHFAISIGNINEYYATMLGTASPVVIPCTGYIASEVVVDCTQQGFGRISLDNEPRETVTECQAITSPAGDLIAASCTTTAPAVYYYTVDE